jgi:hypothetical protein
VLYLDISTIWNEGQALLDTLILQFLGNTIVNV